MHATAVQCRLCRASQRATRAMQRAGWYRCAFCAVANATPLAPHEVFEGPRSLAVLLVEPGRLRFVLPPGSLLERRLLWAIALISSIFAAFLLGGLQLNAEGHWAREFGVPIASASWAAGLLGSMRRHRSAQHLEVTSVWLRGSRRGFGPAWARRRLPARGAEVDLTRETDGAGQPWWVLAISSADRRPIRLRCSGEREARWLGGLVEAFLREEGCAARCASCGAPLRVGLGQRAETRVDCGFCGGGHIVDGERLSLAPVSLPEPSPEPPRALGSRVSEHREGDDVVFRFSSGASWLRLFFAAGLTCAGLLFAKFAGIGVLLGRVALEDGPMGLVLLSGLGVILFGYLGAFALIAALNVWLDSAELRIGAGLVEHALLLGGRRVPAWLQLGGWRAYRRLLMQDEGMQHRFNLLVGFKGERSGSVPLMRLWAVRFADDGGETVGSFEGAARTLQVGWVLDPRDDAWLRARIVEELAGRLSALGRPVRREQSPVPGAAARLG